MSEFRTADRVYRELWPAAELAESVARLWSHTFTGSARSFRVLPDGCIDLIWTGSELRVAGPDTGPNLTDVRPGTTMLGLRFHPGAAPPVLGVPARELRDERVELAELWPAARVTRLVDALATASVDGTGAGAARVLHDAVRDALRVAPARDRAVAAAVVRLRAGEGVAGAAGAVGLSARQLHRRSLHAFGYGAKTLHRILRFRAAVDLAYLGVPLAEVAARAGYADQPHLSREVAELAGIPLRHLLGAQPAGSGANRSTELPSGSSTAA